jgi:hypothetical protein
MQKLDMNTVAQGMKSDLSVFGKESAFAEAPADKSDFGSSIEIPFKNLHAITEPDLDKPRTSMG